MQETGRGILQAQRDKYQKQAQASKEIQKACNETNCVLESTIRQRGGVKTGI